MEVPKPTAQEIAARDKWAAVVSPAARQQVTDEAARHTAWSEKRKVRYEIERFQHVYKQEQSRKSHAATRPATRATTRPATRATTRPATRATTRPSSGGG
jgi:hypothetical protein